MQQLQRIETVVSSNIIEITDNSDNCNANYISDSKIGKNCWHASKSCNNNDCRDSSNCSKITNSNYRSYNIEL